MSDHGIVNAARRWREARHAEALAKIGERADLSKAADLQKMHFQRMLRLTPSRAMADLILELEDGMPEAELQRLTRHDLVAFLTRQRTWSEKTFGPGHRPVGVIAHIRKELQEVAAAPTDLTEWIDVVLLAFDGAWRAGYAPAAIVEELHRKFEENQRRRWPDWREGSPDQPTEHVREAL